jgi:hypothetical protein
MIARDLLGLMFTAAGLNGFLNFIPAPPLVNPLANQFLVAVSESHFVAFRNYPARQTNSIITLCPHQRCCPL